MTTFDYHQQLPTPNDMLYNNGRYHYSGPEIVSQTEYLPVSAHEGKMRQNLVDMQRENTPPLEEDHSDEENEEQRPSRTYRIRKSWSWPRREKRITARFQARMALWQDVSDILAQAIEHELGPEVRAAIRFRNVVERVAVAQIKPEPSEEDEGIADVLGDFFNGEGSSRQDLDRACCQDARHEVVTEPWAEFENGKGKLSTVKVN